MSGILPVKGAVFFLNGKLVYTIADLAKLDADSYPCDANCQACFVDFPDSDFYGNDYPNNPAPIPSLSQCQGACYADQNCLAYTFTGQDGMYSHLTSWLTPLTHFPTSNLCFKLMIACHHAYL